MKKATELCYLRWFYAHADFGPADGDVRFHMNQDFIEEFKMELPEGYDNEE